MDGQGELSFNGSVPVRDLLNESLTKPLDYDLGKLRWEKIYCQACSKEITYVGGVVSNSGKIYCDQGSITGNNFCLDKELLSMLGGGHKDAIGFHYFKPEKVQEAIKEEKLVAFGPLELKV